MSEMYWLPDGERKSRIVSESNPLPVNPTTQPLVTLSEQTLSPGAAAVAIDIPPGSNPVRAYLGPVETANVRWWKDGSSPTTTVGHLLSVGDDLELLGYSDIANFRVIAVTGSPTIPCTLEVLP